MKKIINFLPIIICSLLMAAHFGRANFFILQILSLLVPLLLIWKSKISAVLIQILLFLYAMEWIRTIFSYVNTRTEKGEDWFRLALILGIVALINLATILVFRTKYMKQRFRLN